MTNEEQTTLAKQTIETLDRIDAARKAFRVEEAEKEAASKHRKGSAAHRDFLVEQAKRRADHDNGLQLLYFGALAEFVAALLDDHEATKHVTDAISTTRLQEEA